MRQGFCIHFVGGFKADTVCPAGHCIQDTARPLTTDEIAWGDNNFPGTDRSRTAIFRRIPCAAENGVHCPDYQEPTAEALAEYDEMLNREVQSFLQNVQVARPAIIAHIKDNGHMDAYVASDIPCPICGSGTLHYTYAGHYNGHVHAECSTAECINWME